MPEQRSVMAERAFQCLNQAALGPAYFDARIDTFP
jgi:hypothetical protein